MSHIVFETVALTNFRSFSGTHVFVLDRGPALVYIAGQNRVDPQLGANGVGKSTLFDALLWVLYGKTGRDNRPGASVEPWAGPPATKVSLQLVVDDKSMTITRSRNPNALTVQYAERAKGTVVQEDIERILGLTESMFRCAVVLSQSSSLFLDLKSEAQSQMFTDALDLDQWLVAAKKAGERKKALGLELETAKLTLAKTEGRLAEVKAQLKDELVAMKDFERDQNEKVKQTKYLLRKMHDELKALPDADQRIKGLEKELHGLTLTQSRLESQLHAAKAVMAGHLKDLTGYRKAVRADKKVCPECGQAVGVQHLESKIAALEENYALAVKTKDIVTKQLSKHEAKLQEQRTWINKEQLTLNKVIALKADIKAQQTILDSLLDRSNVHALKVTALRNARDTLDEAVDGWGAQVSHKTKDVGIAEYWMGAFKEIRLDLIDQVLAELSLAATRHAEALGLSGWQIGFATERENKSGSLSASFQTLLYPDGQDTAVRFESYSGGESQRLQLAIAFALSEIVLARAGVTLNLEALDEPTRGLSAEGVEALLEHLRDRAQSLRRTCFVIEHHSLLSGNFDETMMIVKTERGSEIQL